MLRFEMHASQIQGCIVEQRVRKKRKIAESVWVHNEYRGKAGIRALASAILAPYDVIL